MKELNEQHPCIGVHFDKKRQRWEASYWKNKKHQRKVFSTNVYGYDKARELAITERKRLEQAYSHNALLDVLPLFGEHDDTKQQGKSKAINTTFNTGLPKAYFQIIVLVIVMSVDLFDETSVAPPYRSLFGEDEPIETSGKRTQP